MKRHVLTILATMGATVALAGDRAEVSQSVTLKYGWNAFYLTVTPAETADELFGAWPVERVGYYDPAAFLETRQYSGAEATEGVIKTGYQVWRRGEPALSTFDQPVANGVYVCFMTNKADFAATIYGTPVAPRLTWHPSSTNDAMNLVGMAVAPGEKVTFADYFDGLDVGLMSSLKAHRFYGSDPARVTTGPISGADTFANGEVVVMTATKPSDWSGVLNVTPMEGIDFGLYGRQARLSVRNDGAAARDIRLTFRRGEAKPFCGLPPEVPRSILFRNSAGAITNEPWQTVADGTTLTRQLAVGETWELTLAIDRTAFDDKEGTVYGVVAEYADLGSSHMRASVPVTVTDAGARGKGAWPQGLWVAAAELDTVTRIGEAANVGGGMTHELPAGGKMMVRLPVYVDDDGAMWLLQRYEYGYDTNGIIRVASGAVQMDAAEVPPGGRRRLSSPFLPTDQPEIPCAGGTFGTTAEFDFTVGEKSRVNPMLHAQHPRHDGLMADYSGETPSGDDFNNYVSRVKPETFSVKNRVRFAWDETTGAAWDPEETVKGRLTWEFEGLRHAEGEQDGTLRASGEFVMKRVTAEEVSLKK